VELSRYGVAAYPIKINDPAFDTWVAGLRPDVVIFDRFMTEEQFGWRVAQQCPEALRVLDTSDLHCLRVAREAQLKSGGALQLKNETALREIASIYRSDLTLVISEFEREVLRCEFSVPEDLLAYWPFSLTIKNAMPNDYRDREHFFMIGSLLHAPNLDAVRWCSQEIWPKIQEALPKAEMHAYGAYGDRYARELHRPEKGFYFKGRAEEALSTMAHYRVNLAPLRFGAGLKGKIFDGFQTGTPSVVTPIAAEGIFRGGGWAHESAESFAGAAIKLYQDPELWRMRQEAERSVCRERFAASHWRPRLPEIFRRAYRDRRSRREANFTGQMLRHHHHRSTEFLSRWIEAKHAR
jgi:glycosyltransferase involved in cell wall biosynthesis